MGISKVPAEELKKCADAIINNNISCDAITDVFPKPTFYDMVNNPKHYNNYTIEVIDMMENIWGKEKTADWCEMTAFKYRMRVGMKPDNPIEQDLAKERWYLDKAKELRLKI